MKIIIIGNYQNRKNNKYNKNNFTEHDTNFNQDIKGSNCNGNSHCNNNCQYQQ